MRPQQARSRVSTLLPSCSLTKQSPSRHTKLKKHSELKASASLRTCFLFTPSLFLRAVLLSQIGTPAKQPPKMLYLLGLPREVLDEFWKLMLGMCMVHLIPVENSVLLDHELHLGGNETAYSEDLYAERCDGTETEQRAYDISQDLDLEDPCGMIPRSQWIDTITVQGVSTFFRGVGPHCMDLSRLSMLK